MLANFLISSDTTIYKYFSFYEGNLVSANDPIMTQNYVTVSIELCLDAVYGNDEYIIQCNFILREIWILPINSTI